MSPPAASAAAGADDDDGSGETEALCPGTRAFQVEGKGGALLTGGGGEERRRICENVLTDYRGGRGRRRVRSL